jgi:2-C-methyl-D-erythritol 4-phosphate cytidylyltransferase
MHVSAIIVAAGLGSRMGGPLNKHLLLIGGRTVLAHTLSAFQTCSLINDIILVGGQERLGVYHDIVASEGFSKVRAIVRGGETRQESCANGLAAAAAADIVCIHDGARPLVTQRVIVDAVGQAIEHGAAIVAVPVKDTIKTSDDDGFVAETLPRQRLWQVQTPQVFRNDLLRRAQQAARGVFEGTDDAVLLERLGIPVKIVHGDYSNIKITTSDDLAIAERLLAHTDSGERQCYDAPTRS